MATRPIGGADERLDHPARVLADLGNPRPLGAESGRLRTAADRPRRHIRKEVEGEIGRPAQKKDRLLIIVLRQSFQSCQHFA